MFVFSPFSLFAERKDEYPRKKNMTEKIPCSKCGEKLFLLVDQTRKKKYYAHLSSSATRCNFSVWADDVIKPLRVFLSSKKDYFLHLSLSPSVVKEAKDRLLCKIARKNYVQTGRFVPKIKDTIDSIYKLDFIDAIYDNLHVYEEELKSLVPAMSFQQITSSDIVFAVITEQEQYQVVAEIHHAIALGIPVFLKFCHCDRYTLDNYWFTIAAVKSFMSERFTNDPAKAHKLLSPKDFESIDVLKNWKSEKDYVDYLHLLPICLYCHESFSPSLVSKIVSLSGFGETDDDDDSETLEIEFVNYGCHECLQYLELILRKCLFAPSDDATEASKEKIIREILSYMGT